MEPALKEELLSARGGAAMILRAVVHGIWLAPGALWLVGLAGAILLGCLGRGGPRR